MRSRSPLLALSALLMAMPVMAASRSRCIMQCTFGDGGSSRTLNLPIAIDTDSTASLGSSLAKFTNCRIVSCEALPAGVDISFSGVDVAANCGEALSSSLTRAVLCPTLTLPPVGPDLVPSVEACSPNLIVRITNRGTSDVNVATTTRVELDNVATSPLVTDFFTNSIHAGDFRQIDFSSVFGPFSALCSSGCPVIITADWKGEVSETNETNNVLKTSCPP